MSYQELIPLIFTEIVGDFGFKEFANKGGVSNFLVGSAGYVGVIYYLIRSLQGSQILLVNAAWDGLSALIESLAAMIVLGERFDDPYKYLGIVLIVAGLFFLRMPVMSPHKFVFPKFFLS
jgi:multidrug transporter EmrE-like cation transporter